MSDEPATPPRIAVVIPVYNRADVIGRAIDSVFAQDLADFELVVVDDGSSDGTADVVAAIADPRLTLIRGLHRGGNAARNHGLMATTAPLVAFLDSDDEYRPEKLSTVVAMFEAQPSIDTVLDSFTVIDPRKKGGRPTARINRVVENSEAFLVALLDSSVTARRVRKSVSGITVRRKVAIRAGLFDEQIRRRQDMEFLIRLAKTGRCVATDRALWIKHDRADGITARGDGFIEATIVMIERHPEYLADRRLRGGLARDTARYLFETIGRRGPRQVARDLRLLVDRFGIVRVVRLLGRAALVMVVNWATKLGLSRRLAAPKAAPSPAMPHDGAQPS